MGLRALVLAFWGFKSGSTRSSNGRKRTVKVRETLKPQKPTVVPKLLNPKPKKARAPVLKPCSYEGPTSLGDEEEDFGMIVGWRFGEPSILGFGVEDLWFRAFEFRV